MFLSSISLYLNSFGLKYIVRIKKKFLSFLLVGFFFIMLKNLNSYYAKNYLFYFVVFNHLINQVMKLNSKQFKTKSAYFIPFLRAWYLHFSNHLIFKVSIVYVDGTSYHSYCPLISYSVFHRPQVKSALFTFIDEQSYSTELYFFVSFLASCNIHQLVTFLDDMFDSVSACPEEITSEFMKVLPSYIGDARFRFYLSHISNS